MCGILLVASPILGQQQEVCKLLRGHVAACEPALRARGPDHMGQQQVEVCCKDISTCRSDSTASAAFNSTTGSSNNLHDNRPRLLLHLAASLLQLRGSKPSTSPLEDTQGNTLCFNGEVFGGLAVPAGGNDGKCLAAALGACATAEEVVGVLSSLRGPWSVIFWQHERQLLWFGRDWMGKRSLLLKHCQHETTTSSSSDLSSSVVHQCLMLSSVAPVPDQQQQQQQQQTSQAPVSSPAANITIYDWPRINLSTKQLANTSSSSSSSSCGCMQQGTWTDIPPGVYSISSSDLYRSLSTGSSSSGSIIGSGSSSEEPAASAAAAADLPSKSGVMQPSDLCRSVQGLHHHAYTDQQLINLQQYSRQQHLVTPPLAAPAAAAGCVQPHPEAQQQQQQQQQQQAEYGVVCPALQEASQQLLQLLQTAVGVRCLTINTLQQHGHQQQQKQPQQQQQEQNGPQQRNSYLPAPATHDFSALKPPMYRSPEDLHSTASVEDLYLPTAAQHDSHPQQQLAPAPVLILFSGGVDSTLIAALAHRSLPPDLPIDLSNVCFDQGNSPDRIAARSALLELAAFAPDRQWRLIEVDSSLLEVDQLSGRIQKLLHPAATVMDLNIGAALWLAARAEGRMVVPVRVTPAAAAAAAGTVASNGFVARPAAHGWSCNNSSSGATDSNSVDHHWDHKTLDYSTTGTNDSSSSSGAGSYRSAAKVVLLGHGADEQCGGYGRHRTKFRFKGGWQALADELALDVRRLWIRNLGRDDRLIADHGREGRHPFLDEQLMTALLNTPLHVIADFSKPIGVGDKQLLRQALASLGIKGAASTEKRAIQFGTRIGKLSNMREFGSNRKANLMSAGQIRIEALGQL